MIFYFSCTGNTLWTARKVAAATGDRLVDMAAEMMRVPGEPFAYALSEGESIGFFFPVHGWRPPVLVREFAGRLRIADADRRYCYAVCTAGDNVGETIDLLESDLAAVGLHVQSALSLIMPESYIGLPFMYLDKPESERRKKLESDRRLAAFIGDIQNRCSGVRDLTIGRWPKTNSRLLGSVFVKKLVTDRPFRVDSGKCVGCGKCEKTCPVGDIRLDAGTRRPEWLHNGRCLTCFSCYHHCPVNAIEFGRRTKGKGQYYYEKNGL